MKIPRISFLVLLVFFNSLPIYGVFNWNWNSFDIIFLYWCENLIIGLFMILRIAIRPYTHPIEAVLPLLMVPFFAAHYGTFSYGHGTFLIHMFGTETLGEMAKLGIPEIILPVIDSRQLYWPLIGLFAYQLMDWVRDIREHGLGSDSIKELTTAPYRRIFILHITIIASGFALAAADQPTVGLLMLVGFKTGFDIYHWNKDKKSVEKKAHPVIDDKMKQKLDSFINSPKITINGKDVYFNSFEELKVSKHYRLMQAISRMAIGNNGLKMAEEYIETRMKEKQDQYSR